MTRQERDLSRGGFQNRDVGRTNLVFDMGPDYGMDFAHFEDTVSDFRELGHEGFNRNDDSIVHKVKALLLSEDFHINDKIEFIVKNGFVILKGEVRDPQSKLLLTERLKAIAGVYSVINQLKVSILPS